MTHQHPALGNYITWELGGDPIGTHLHSVLNCAYSDLVKLFGKPNEKTDSYKVDVEWVLTFTLFGQFKKVATIYNYKDGKNYLGKREGLAVSKIRDWRIGAHDGNSEVIGYIASMLLNMEK